MGKGQRSIGGDVGGGNRNFQYVVSQNLLNFMFKRLCFIVHKKIRLAGWLVGRFGDTGFLCSPG